MQNNFSFLSSDSLEGFYFNYEFNTFCFEKLNNGKFRMLVELNSDYLSRLLPDVPYRFRDTIACERSVFAAAVQMTQAMNFEEWKNLLPPCWGWDDLNVGQLGPFPFLCYRFNNTTFDLVKVHHAPPFVDSKSPLYPALVQLQQALTVLFLLGKNRQIMQQRSMNRL